MLIVTCANFFAIILSFIGRIVHRERICFLLSILWLIAFYSIRADYGNDIPAYKETFERISNLDFSSLNEETGHFEPGWIVLNLFFSQFGWQFFLTFLTVFQFFTVFWFITKYSSPHYYWLIFSIYVLSSNLLLTDLSMLRQAFAMNICCFAVPLILARKIFKSMALIALAASVHTSALIVLILIIFPFLSNINSKVIIIVFISLFITLKIVESLIGDVLELVLALETFEKYEIYEVKEDYKGSGLFTILQAIICVWLLLKHANTYNSKFFCLVMCLSVLLLPFVETIQLIARVSMYFRLISIVVYQYFLDTRKFSVGFIFLLITIYVAFMGYFAFFESPVWKPYFSVYHTIFD